MSDNAKKPDELLGMLTDEQREAVKRDGNAAYIMRNLVDNHGFSWV